MIDWRKFPPENKSNNHEESDPLFCIFTTDECCSYGDAAYTSIEKCVTIYREEIITQSMPDEVHVRLHSAIKQRWIISRQNIEWE
jgi:hypothetical protein